MEKFLFRRKVFIDSVDRCSGVRLQSVKNGIVAVRGAANVPAAGSEFFPRLFRSKIFLTLTLTLPLNLTLTLALTLIPNRNPSSDPNP